MRGTVEHSKDDAMAANDDAYETSIATKPPDNVPLAVFVQPVIADEVNPVAGATSRTTSLLQQTGRSYFIGRYSIPSLVAQVTAALCCFRPDVIALFKNDHVCVFLQKQRENQVQISTAR
jgi:hypothetical protein